MLSKQRCPHSGLVNFYTDIDPFMSVGSIIETGPSRYVWRSSTTETGGVAYAAHVGGFITGLVLTLLFPPRNSP